MAGTQVVTSLAVSEVGDTFTKPELELVLRRLRRGKTAGTDTIPAEMLQHLGPVGRDALLRLANASWAAAAVPET